MNLRQLSAAIVFVGFATTLSGQVGSTQASTFIGTWVFTMTEPEEMKGATHTVRIRDQNGTLAASFQVGKFPANDFTGILKDGNLLVLTTTVRENGVPIWAVVALTPEGDSMKMSLTLEPSRTIKRGTGRKRTD